MYKACYYLPFQVSTGILNTSLQMQIKGQTTIAAIGNFILRGDWFVFYKTYFILTSLSPSIGFDSFISLIIHVFDISIHGIAEIWLSEIYWKRRFQTYNWNEPDILFPFSFLIITHDFFLILQKINNIYILLTLASTIIYMIYKVYNNLWQK